jgi:Xaa-Pro dipeptidase
MWLTGLAPEIEWGPSPFSAPAVCVVDPAGGVLLVASEDEAGGAVGGIEVRCFPGFAVEDVDRPSVAAELALAALSGCGELAVELASLPGVLVRELVLAGVDLVDVAPELRVERAVKDPDEVEAIRRAVEVANAGQAAARSGLAAGRRELDVWSETRRAMEAHAGSRLPVLADFVTGERTADVGGSPGNRVVSDGDLLLVDLVPRVGGYWADSCATVAAGEPPRAARDAHEACLAALERAIELIRPGAIAGEIDAAARATAGDYPHHTGHGIGTTSHEEPRLIPNADRVLEAGMVIAVEPGSYDADWGVRLERVVLVTEDGCEILSGHDLSL